MLRREGLREDESGKKNAGISYKRKKKDADNGKATGVMMSRDRLPLIGSSGRSAARPVLSTPQYPPQPETKKRGHPTISSMAPWEGSSHSDSSFASFPPPLSPLPPPQSKPITAPDPRPPPPPHPIKNTQPEHGPSARVKRRPLPPRRPPRPPRLPPLRPVTNLSFSRSFTFSFFELPVHQSARSRAERLRNLTLLLKQIHY